MPKKKTLSNFTKFFKESVFMTEDEYMSNGYFAIKATEDEAIYMKVHHNHSEIKVLKGTMKTLITENQRESFDTGLREHYRKDMVAIFKCGKEYIYINEKYLNIFKETKKEHDCLRFTGSKALGKIVVYNILDEIVGIILPIRMDVNENLKSLGKKEE